MRRRGIILYVTFEDRESRIYLIYFIDLLQTQDKRTTHALARTDSFIIFWSFYKHALHGWSISTLLSTYLILRCGPYQLIALSPCLPHFLSLSMLHHPPPFSFRPRKQTIKSYSLYVIVGSKILCYIE